LLLSLTSFHLGHSRAHKKASSSTSVTAPPNVDLTT